MDKFWKYLSLLAVLAVFVAVMTHAYGFSLAAGTLFQGLHGIQSDLEGGSIQSGGTSTFNPNAKK